MNDKITLEEMEQLKEWEEALPEFEDSISIALQPYINEKSGTVDLQVYLRSDRMKPGKKYHYNCSFAPRSEQGIYYEELPLEMDHVVTQIQSSLSEVFREYIFKEVIDSS